MRPVDSIPMDGRVFAFALLVSCLTGVLFGIAPASSALRSGVNEPLKEGGRTVSSRRPNRLRHVLVASEVALALVVLSGAGLMIKSMTRLLGVDPGLNPKNVLTMQMSVPQEEIYVGPPGLPRFCQDLDEHVGAIPGVVSVGAVGHLPFDGNAGRGFQIEGRPPADPGKMPGASYTVACPELLPDHGHSGSERARVHAAGYRERARRDRDQREDGARFLAEGGPGRQSHPAGRVRWAAPHRSSAWSGTSIILGLDVARAPPVLPALHASGLAGDERRGPHHQHARHLHHARQDRPSPDVLPDLPCVGRRDHGRRSCTIRRAPGVSRCCCSACSRCWPWCWRRSGSWAWSAIRWRSARTRSAFAWRSARETLDVLRLMVNSNMAWVLVGLALGRRRLGGAYAAARRNALRRAAARSRGAGRRIVAAGRRGAARQLFARAPRRENRPHRRVALRMTQEPPGLPPRGSLPHGRASDSMLSRAFAGGRTESAARRPGNQSLSSETDSGIRYCR